MKKLESIIFYLLIFSVPVQSRLILHEWVGPFNQWTSAYLYGTDILLGLLLIFWLVRFLKINKSRISNFPAYAKALAGRQFPISNKFPISKFLNLSSFWLGIFFTVSALSIFNSGIVGLSFYQLLKLAEFIGFFFYLKSNLGKIFQLKTVLAVIVASGLFQAVVGIIQYAKQGGLGLRLLGESPLSVNATGVAVFFADGVKYLRAYGTTPHPNILAAWLFAAIFAFYFYFLYLSDKESSPSVARRAKEGLLLAVYSILLFGLFFSFSRVIIGFWVLGVSARLLVVFLKKEFWRNDAIRRGTLKLTIISAVVVAIFSFLYWPQVQSRIRISSQEEAVTQRAFYSKIAGSTAASHPFLGVGLGQFVPSLMSKFKHLPAGAYQPVHNIYLFIASETGFVGLGVFLIFLSLIFWRFVQGADFKKLRNFSFLIFAFSFLIFGLFDHFLWTSQQGSLIFWMGLALLNTDFG